MHRMGSLQYNLVCLPLRHSSLFTGKKFAQCLSSNHDNTQTWVQLSGLAEALTPVYMFFFLMVHGGRLHASKSTQFH